MISAAVADRLEPSATEMVPYQPKSGDFHENMALDNSVFLASIAISLKRIADSFNNAGSEQGSVLWWLENIASAANAERSL